MLHQIFKWPPLKRLLCSVLLWIAALSPCCSPGRQTSKKLFVFFISITLTAVLIEFVKPEVTAMDQLPARLKHTDRKEASPLSK